MDVIAVSYTHLNLQNRIKEKIKVATDLEVKEVNITVKKVAPKQEEA